MSTPKQVAPKSEYVGRSVLDSIGNTPLLRLERIARDYPNVEFAAKAEWFNPGGSVKDRPALSMIQAGLSHAAHSRRARRIIDATSGNTGIAYAMIGAALGYPSNSACPTALRTSASAFSPLTAPSW